MTNPEQKKDPPETPVGIVMRDTLGDLLDTMEAVDQVSGTVAASRAQLIDSARQVSEAMAREQAADGAVRLGSEPHGWEAKVRLKRELIFDIAVRLRVSEPAAERLIAESKRLVHALLPTHAVLATGEISYRHAQVIIDESYGMDDPLATELEAVLLPAAKELTVAKFKEFARKLRERLHPGGMDERHRSAVDKRTVTLDFDRDGMALLAAYLPAEIAMAAHDRLTRFALAMGKVMGSADAPLDDSTKDTRTLAQRRADALGALLVDGDLCEAGDPAPHGIVPQLLVTVPMLTILGAEEAPGQLNGYGPIAPETARDLAARASSFARVLTDPVNGVILDFDQSKYAVTTDLRKVLKIQFPTCSAPGCNRPAEQCDMDHTEDYAKGGTTSLGNLAPLCKTHHNLKHHSAVNVRKLADGSMRWVTPTGRAVIIRPENPLGEEMMRRGSAGGTAGGDPPGVVSGWDMPATSGTFPF